MSNRNKNKAAIFQLRKIPERNVPEVKRIMEEQRKAFLAKFGREPGPDDPIFFDPDAAIPQQISEEASKAGFAAVLDLMEKQGIDPALVHAARKTDRILTKETYALCSREEQREWDEAIAEYDRSKKGN